MNKYIKYILKYAIYIGFLQAWTATLGSLYCSEVKGLVPCLLCWYQRILMYPLAIMYAVALWKRHDKDVAYYALPLSIIGAILAFYQYLLQWTILKDLTPITCNAYAPCSDKQVVYLGFITIPFLSLMAFLLITFLNIILIKYKNHDKRK